MIATSQYYRVTARVGVPHRYEVEVTVPLVGPAGAVGATGATGATGANGANGANGAAGSVGPQGPVGPVGPAGTTDYNELTNKPTIPTASTTTPAALGTAAVGTGTTFARADHVHALPFSVTTAESLYDVGLSQVGAVVSDAVLNLYNVDDYAASLIYENITANRGYTLPDASGTIALTNQISSNLWIAASQFIPRTTNGCGVDSREVGATNRANVDELLFETGTEEFAQALVVMPSNYNNGTVSARFYWSAASGSGGVAWGLSGRAYGDDDALDQASGTRIAVTDTFITANDVHVTSATSAVTITGTPAANKAINFQISRVVGDAADTLGVDARLLGVEIIYTAA